MNRLLTILIALTLTLSSTARASDTDDSFLKTVDLKELRSLSVQDDQTLKTWDSWARQTLSHISGSSSYEGHSALAVLIDISVNPRGWIHRPIVKIANAPLASDIAKMPGLDDSERKRLQKEKRISIAFWRSPTTQAYVQEIYSRAMHKVDAINQVEGAVQALEAMMQSRAGLPDIAIIPPRESGGAWMTLTQAIAEPKEVRYSSDRLGPVASAWLKLTNAWLERNPQAVSLSATELAGALPKLAPERYPSKAKRNAEVLYNKLYKLTLPGAALYFFAFVFYLMSARAGVRWPWRLATLMFVLGLIVHTTGVGIRWWLVQKSTESWFYAIPIKNQFEAVMMSVWLGAMLTLALEIGLIHWLVRQITGYQFRLGERRGIYGAAGSFLGWLALIAIFTVTRLLGVSIGEEIGQVGGILMHWMLYVHVSLAVASYALITMSALMGAWWIVRRLTSGRDLLVLDACNLVVLQLAFLVLGVAIVLGAVWADFSWGRPWGWDPKETFALVTWIVYLVILHVRLITKSADSRAGWTSVLSVVGFFVMLFNWIGVNYFLVGLHSYA